MQYGDNRNTYPRTCNSFLVLFALASCDISIGSAVFSRDVRNRQVSSNSQVFRGMSQVKSQVKLQVLYVMSQVKSQVATHIKAVCHVWGVHSRIM